MSLFIDQLRNSKGTVPCLFYPMAKKAGIPVTRLLSDSKTQAELLVDTSENMSVDAVIRMTELWCEAASFGMEYNIKDNDFPKLGKPICKNIGELDDVKIPKVENMVTAPLIDAVRLSVPHMEKPLIVGATGPYTLCSALNGSEKFMINCMTDPDSIHDLLNRVTNYLIEYISTYKSVGASGVILAEPSTCMISPDMMDEFSNAYILKIIKAVQDNTFSLIYHNCGSVNNHLDNIAKLDADAFHFGNEVDLDRALDLINKEQYVMGNIDPRVFITASQTQIERHTTKLLNNYSKAANWKLSTGCDLSPNASMKNVEYFFKCVDKF